MKRILLASTIVLASTAARAETGMEFYHHCSNGFKTTLNPQCESYVTGITNGLVAGHSGTVCLPYGVTGKQLLLIVQNYMRNHPEVLNQESSSVIAQAMNGAYPCP